MSNKIINTNSIHSPNNVKPFYQQPPKVIEQLFLRGIQLLDLTQHKSIVNLSDTHIINYGEFRDKAKHAEELYVHLNTLLQKMKDPDSDFPLEDFHKYVPSELIAQLEKSLKVFFPNENINKLLKRNPGILLQLRDLEEKNPLEQYLQHLSKKIDHLHKIKNGYLLLSYSAIVNSSQDLRYLLQSKAVSSDEAYQQFMSGCGFSQETIDLVMEKPELLFNISKLNRQIHRSKSLLKIPFHYSGMYYLAEKTHDPSSIDQFQNLYLQHQNLTLLSSKDKEQEINQQIAKNFLSMATQLFEESVIHAIDSHPKELCSICSQERLHCYSRRKDILTSIQFIQKLIIALHDPNTSNKSLSELFKFIKDDKVYTAIEETLQLFFPDNVDEILQNNPRILLQIKDKSGKTLLKQYIDYLYKLADDLCTLEDLYQIQAYILQIKSGSDNSVNLRILHHPLSHYKEKLSFLSPAFEEIVPLHNPKLFNQLFLQIEGTIVEIKSTVSAPFHFIGIYMLSEGILPDDTQPTADDIQKMHQVQHFYFELMQPVSEKHKKIAFQTFVNLDIEIKTALGKAVWIAHFQPIDGSFSADTILQQNPYLLLDCKDESGNNILVQLINHYQTKIELQRFIPEFKQFAAQFDSVNDRKTLIEMFQRLPIYAQYHLAHLIAAEHEKKGIPTYFGYGMNRILSYPRDLKKGPSSILQQYEAILSEKLSFDIVQRVDQFQKERTMPEGSVDCSLKNQLPIRTLEGTMGRIVMVTAEFRGVFDMGGLGPAVKDMAESYGAHKTRIIMPKYDVIPSSIRMQEKDKYQIILNVKVYKVFKATLKEGFKCYFIEHSRFESGLKNNKNIYEAEFDQWGNKIENPDAEKSRRWVDFSLLAAELIDQMSKKPKNPVQLVHCHDAQTALVPWILQTKHPIEWKEGSTPATVFSYHNNLSPLYFTYEEVQNYLGEVGLPNDPFLALVKGIESADMCTTVSETFALETQGPLFGNHMQKYVKEKAFNKQVVGIVNGYSQGWDPKTDPQLKNWKTKDGQTLDLTYGPDSHDLAHKIIAIRQQIAEYVDHFHLGKIDPRKPLFFFIGRYDSNQKGVDKLPLIMKEALLNGAQFICIGMDPDKEADSILSEMEAFADGKEGICIIRDFKREDGNRYWQQGPKEGNASWNPEDKNAPGFGSLLRAGVDIAVFPSIFEPCGLVQGEMHCMGVETMATNTGGFSDTIFTSGNLKNGYLFQRHDKWEQKQNARPIMDSWKSEEQDDFICETLWIAAQNASERLKEIYSNDQFWMDHGVHYKREIMRYAAASTWTTTYDGSYSAAMKYHLVYEQAIRNLQKRGTLYVDMHALCKGEFF